MGNFATVQDITTNLVNLLRAQGLVFEQKIYEPKNIPAASLPAGEVFYESETFENSFNMRPSYVEARWNVRVIFREKSQIDLNRVLQDWTHRIRGAVTVDAINTGGLSASKLVSRADLEETANESINPTMAALLAQVVIRYRET